MFVQALCLLLLCFGYFARRIGLVCVSYLICVLVVILCLIVLVVCLAVCFGLVVLVICGLCYFVVCFEFAGLIWCCLGVWWVGFCFVVCWWFADCRGLTDWCWVWCLFVYFGGGLVIVSLFVMLVCCLCALVCFVSFSLVVVWWLFVLGFADDCD